MKDNKTLQLEVKVMSKTIHFIIPASTKQIQISKVSNDLENRFLLFRDKSSFDYSDCSNSDSYLLDVDSTLEGCIESFNVDSEKSGKEFLIYGTSRIGNEAEVNQWKQLSEIDLFEVDETTYKEVKDNIRALGFRNEKANDTAFKLQLEHGLKTADFIFDLDKNLFTSRCDSTINYHWNKL